MNEPELTPEQKAEQERFEVMYPVAYEISLRKKVGGEYWQPTWYANVQKMPDGTRAAFLHNDLTTLFENIKKHIEKEEFK